MKYVFFALCNFFVVTSSCMEKAVHSLDLSKTLFNYCMSLGSLDPNAIASIEARSLYKFLDAHSRTDPLILTLTAQELSARCLDDVYLILHGRELNRSSIPTRKAKKQLIEESARSIEALLGYLLKCSKDQLEH